MRIDMSKKKMIWLAPVAILALALFIAAGGMVVRELWNWLLPPLFGLRTVTFWQALGILALSRILFGGFGFHGNSGSRGRKAKRWEGMSAEERERFRQGIGERCGLGASASEGQGQ